MTTARLTGIILTIVLLGLLPPGPVAAQAPTFAFADPAFEQLWQGTDGPVAAKAVARGWLWGPAPSTSLREPYVDSPNESRLVQYFDKSRMEITDPWSDRGRLTFVSNGLLAKELVSGDVQTGAALVKVDVPASLAVAGDPDDPATPTYFSFRAVASLAGDNRAPNHIGQPVVATIDRAGAVGALADAPSPVTVAVYSEPLGHNIPDVFDDYLRALPLDWVFVMGLPITEPYWATVTLGGQPRSALIQVFERRVLTYTPDNPAAWRVEMGNVGQHYVHWRYQATVGMPAKPRSSMLTFPFPNSPTLAAAYGLPDRPGYVLIFVLPGGPADRAGLRRGDLIVAVEGRPVTPDIGLDAPGAYRSVSWKTPVGGQFRLTVLQAGVEREVTITTTTQPPDYAAQAVRALTEAIAARPRDAGLYWARGGAQLQAPAALADFTRAIELNPALGEAYVGRGLVHAAMGSTEAAIADFRHVQTLPVSAEAHFEARLNLATQYLRRRAYVEAHDAADQAVRTAPGDAQGWARLAEVEAIVGLYDRALTTSTNAIRRNPLALSGLAYRVRGRVLQAVGRPADALLDLQTVVP